MSKRTIAIVIAFLSCFIMGVCGDTVMTTWPVNTSQMLVALVVFVSLFYIGLDLLRATETSLLYRLVKNNPFSAGDPLMGVRVMGVFIILMSLVFGWVFIGRLLGLIK
jgi:hypothetical protein